MDQPVWEYNSKGGISDKVSQVTICAFHDVRSPPFRHGHPAIIAHRHDARATFSPTYFFHDVRSRLYPIEISLT
jgi:hypothetical protein